MSTVRYTALTPNRSKKLLAGLDQLFRPDIIQLPMPFEQGWPMSALPPKADMQHSRDVR
jgi:hypothetical protein